MIPCKSPDCQGTHAVTEQDQGKIRKLLVHFPVHHLNILQNSICTAAIHITKVIHGADAFPMASVVVDHAYIASLCHVFHKWKITLLVFAHAVNKLQDSPVRRLVRNHCQNGNIKAVRLGFYISFVFCTHSFSAFLFFLV